MFQTVQRVLRTLKWFKPVRWNWQCRFLTPSNARWFKPRVVRTLRWLKPKKVHRSITFYFLSKSKCPIALQARWWLPHPLLIHRMVLCFTYQVWKHDYGSIQYNWFRAAALGPARGSREYGRRVVYQFYEDVSRRLRKNHSNWIQKWQHIEQCPKTIIQTIVNVPKSNEHDKNEKKAIARRWLPHPLLIHRMVSYVLPSRFENMITDLYNTIGSEQQHSGPQEAAGNTEDALCISFANTYQVRRHVIDNLWEMFKACDGDDMHVLDMPKFVLFCKRISKDLKLHAKSIGNHEHLFETIDVDGSGCLDFGEIVKWYCEFCKIGIHAVRKLFNVFIAQRPTTKVIFSGAFFADCFFFQKTLDSILKPVVSQFNKKEDAFSLFVFLLLITWFLADGSQTGKCSLHNPLNLMFHSMLSQQSHYYILFVVFFHFFLLLTFTGFLADGSQTGKFSF